MMNWDSDFSDPNYLLAVAATAYAIESLEQSKSRYQSNKINNEAGDTRGLSEPDKTALKPTSVKTSFKDHDTSSSISISMSENSDEETNDKPDESSESEEARSLCSLEKQLSTIDSRKLDTAVSGTDSWPTGWEFTSRPLEIKLLQSGTRPRPEDAKADAWEKEEMARIRYRYEKLRDTIEDWALKKKNKAKQKLERIEADLNKRAASALKHYHSQIARIEGVAGGARAEAEEKCRIQELKAREKANKIRSTGKC